MVVVRFIRFVVFGVKFEFVGIVIRVIDREIILVVLIGLSGYFFIVFFFLELIILIGVVWGWGWFVGWVVIDGGILVGVVVFVNVFIFWVKGFCNFIK